MRHHCKTIPIARATKKKMREAVENALRCRAGHALKPVAPRFIDRIVLRTTRERHGSRLRQ